MVHEELMIFTAWHSDRCAWWVCNTAEVNHRNPSFTCL